MSGNNFSYPLNPRPNQTMRVPEHLIRRRIGVPRNVHNADVSAPNTTSNNSPDAPFEPSFGDVAVVRRIFKDPRTFLPTELVDAIIDYAEYWPHSSTHVDYVAQRDMPLNLSGTTSNEDTFLFRCPPIGWATPPCRGDYATHKPAAMPPANECDRSFFEKHNRNTHPELEFPVRKIIFTIKSRDQGWASEMEGPKGGYSGSWTWFEAGLERFDKTECENSNENSPFSPNALRSVQPPIAPNDSVPVVIDERLPPAPADPFKHATGTYPDKHHTVQINKKATTDISEHRVTWSHTDCAVNQDDAGVAAIDESLRQRGSVPPCIGGDFVRKLRLGDVVTLWGHARFPAWRNMIYSARVDIYWAI